MTICMFPQCQLRVEVFEVYFKGIGNNGIVCASEMKTVSGNGLYIVA